MSAKVIKFYPADASKKADNVLELAAGVYNEVILIGYDKDGMIHARSTLGLKDGGDLLWLIETFKHKLMNGDFFGDDE